MIPTRLASTAGIAGVDLGGLMLSAEVQRRANISYRQLDYWCRRGLLHEAVSAQGSGTARAFDEDSVRVACALAALSRNGLGASHMASPGFGACGRLVIEHVRENGLTGTVTSEDGVLIVDLDAVPYLTLSGTGETP